MLVQFGNNWIQNNFSDSQIGRGLRPRPILAVLGIFLIQLFPNWTVCSPVTYTNYWREACYFHYSDIVVANSCFYCYSVGVTFAKESVSKRQKKP